MLAALAVIAVAGQELWDAETCYVHLVRFKEMLKTQRVVWHTVKGKSKPNVTKYPISAEEWKTKHGDKIEEHIACPISISTIEYRKMNMAARKTHKSLGRQIEPKQSLSAGSSMSPQDFFKMMMRSCMGQGAGQDGIQIDFAPPTTEASFEVSSRVADWNGGVS